MQPASIWRHDPDRRTRGIEGGFPQRTSGALDGFHRRRRAGQRDRAACTAHLGSNTGEAMPADAPPAMAGLGRLLTSARPLHCPKGEGPLHGLASPTWAWQCWLFRSGHSAGGLLEGRAGAVLVKELSLADDHPLSSTIAMSSWAASGRVTAANHGKVSVHAPRRALIRTSRSRTGKRLRTAQEKDPAMGRSGHRHGRAGRGCEGFPTATGGTVESDALSRGSDRTEGFS